MDEIEKDELQETEYKNKIETWTNEEDMKLEKKRRKRIREKEAKKRKKNMTLSGVKIADKDQKDGGDNDINDDEFQYVAILGEKQCHTDKKSDRKNDGDSTNEKDDNDAAPVSNDTNVQNKVNSTSAIPIPFQNDGSFLELMKKKLEQEQKQG